MNDPDECDLLNPFELYGQWWRAGENEAKRVSGCLSYTPDHGLQLQLYDDLPGEMLSFLTDSFGKPIWGELSGYAGKNVQASLFRVIRTNRPNDPRAKEQPAAHTIFFVNHAILGAHTLEPNSLMLSSIHFSISDLESFANTPPVAALGGQDSVKVDYTRHKRLELTLEQPPLRATLATLLGYTSSLVDRHCTIRYREEMALIPQKPLPFGECEDIVWSLTNLLLICARESAELRYVRGISPTGNLIHSLTNRRRRSGRLTWSDWVLTLNELKPFEQVLTRWFSLVKKLRFVGPVFFSELRSPSSVQDARFFHFAGCLEAFHREVVHAEIGKFLPRKEYREITKLLLDDHLPETLSEGLKDSMRSALSHANDHSFAERLDSLFGLLEPETQRMLADEPKRFLAAIKHSRNKLAHVTDERPGEGFEGVEFAHANLSLRVWITILMLKECGVAEAIIRERMTAINYCHWGPFKFEPQASI